eukprot:TRINITY_DN647_c0_g1_i4.p1 TRINITY_DN647_c0_g1~~TRINITY_DN647_c0_g1_i4.p1  ORF type:complete len:110 (+),score=19.09 TRINITY_DN647_c0_g1_i4:762-1091(+)
MTERRWSVVGTEESFPPEFVKGEGHSFPVDIWGLGCSLFECLTGEVPYLSHTREQLFQAIVNEPINFDRNVRISCQNNKLVSQLLEKDPLKRISAIDAVTLIQKSIEAK